MITECINSRLLKWSALLAAGLMVQAMAGAAEVKRKLNPKHADTFLISYLSFADDEHYEKRRAYAGVTLKQQTRPLNGVTLGIRAARITGRSLGVRFELAEHQLDPEQDYVAEAVEWLLQNQSGAAILDLPKKVTIEIAAALGGKPVILFNPRHRDNDLRGMQCFGQLFHTIPSHAMLMDALNQYLKSRNWSKVLMLTGPTEDDASLSLAYRQSAKKFAIRVVSDNPFVLGNDPRDRNKTNISLLTGRPKHDIVFVADSLGEFARYVPYQTYYSRLVIGSEGLQADAWHWAWERHGAPQLNQRFSRKFDTRMSAEQWAGWAAVKALTSAARMAKSIEYSELMAALSSQDLILDLYKGAPGNFRAWNNQLRQPILLRTHNAVVSRAPLEGFLHHRNTLDTLGIDELESDCVW
ncbi:hypothetical protein AB833_09735 [Chromatiales bacterium (ex Bugula neritina AB1)]|nr:hypothetical protein AB833_09735 [Chromatiales bacterium (ex Bugula neritina AB1)]